MTIKEFSNKYHVPYHIVFKASYGVKGVGQMRDRNYEEKDLLEECIRQAEKMIRKYRKLVVQYDQILRHLKGTS